MKHTQATGRSDEAIDEVLQSLLRLRSYEAFENWIASNDPKVRSAVLRTLLRKRSQRHGGLSYAAWLDLLTAAPADPRGAWERREAEAKAVETFTESFDEELDPVVDLLAGGNVEEAIAIYDRMIARGRSLRAGGQVGFLQKLRAGLLQIRPEGSRAENLEEAIEALNEALSYARAGAPSLETMLELARLYTEREVGDRVDNLAIASNMLEEAIGLATDEDPLELRGQLEYEFGKSLMRREDGDRKLNLERGIAVAEEAADDLEAAGSPGLWIRAKLTLGGLLVNHARAERSSTAAGEAVFEDVIAWSMTNEAPEMAAAAHHELARTKRTATNHSSMEVAEAIESGTADEQEERDENLRLEAAEHLRAAEELLGEAPDGVEIAQVRGELCLLLSRLEEDEAAIEAGRRALETLSPTRMTRLCFEVAAALAASFARRGEWHEAAQAYRSVFAASDLIFRGLRDDARRRDETQEVGELGRWAAFAFSLDGQPAEAATALENARTRELRRRLGLGGGDSGRLWELPGELRRAYESALGELASSPLGRGDAPGRELRDALVEIRKLPGFEKFATGDRLEDLLAATEPGWPLLYVNPTPAGAVLVLVDDSGSEKVVTRHLAEPSSTLVFMRLLADSGYEEDSDFDVEEAGPSYLMAIGGIAREDPSQPSPAERDGALEEAIVDALGWLGSALAQPIAELLREVGARGVTLVPCGPLSTVPLAAAPWSTEGGSRCLLDEFEVRYAPSGALVRTSLARATAQSSKAQRLVGLADPQENLPGARPELEEIAALVGGEADLAFGPAATSEFLRTHAADASHLHLACHAGGGLYDLEAMVVCLADGDLAAMELGGTLESRLVVVSACQSALPYIAGPSGEAFATSTAFLAAGSACVVASLWPVDDLATAILMTRLYEEMFENEHRPPEALRRAQAWLRELTYKEEAAFLAAHPQLAAEALRRSERGERIGAPPSAADTWLQSGRPFAHPRYWAPFIAIGI
ncbi:MAG: CHAT domain-containing protein [Actinobacteria bacterium]|nr:CHAT domain-containing protein [Actinomycetota bacterium]